MNGGIGILMTIYHEHAGAAKCLKHLEFFKDNRL